MRSRALFVAALVLAAGLIVVPLPVQAQATQTLVEDFEDDTSLDPPAADWYSFASTGTVSSFVTNAEAVSGTQSLRNSYATNDATVRTDFSGLNLCNGGEVRLWFKWSSFAASTAGRGTGFSIASGTSGAIKDGEANAVVVYVEDGTTSLKVDVKTSTGSQVTGTLGTVAANTWYDFRIYNINCASASVRVSSTTINNAVTVDHASGSITSLTRFKMGSQSTTERPTGIHYADDLELRDVPIPPTPPPDFSPAASFTAPVGHTIVGFDVDEAGQTVILRIDPGGGGTDYVQTLGGSSLSGSSTAETQCDRTGGVASIGTHVTYLQCDPGDASDVTQLRIRSASLGAPSFGSSCIPDVFGGGNSCTQDISDEDLASVEDALHRIEDVKSFPFDYNQRSGSATTATVFISWAFSTLTGDMGVVTYAFRNNAPDRSNVDTVSVSSDQQSLQGLCATRGSDSKDYLYGGEDDSNTVGARIDFTEQTGPDADIEVDLVPIFNGHTTTAGASGIGCGGDRFFVATFDERLSVWQRSGSAYGLVWSGTATGSITDHGAAMSNDGEFVAYLDSTAQDGYVLSADNGSVVASFDWAGAAGAVVDLQMDSRAQSVWLATTGGVYRFEVYTATTGTAEASAVDTTPPSVDVVGGGGPVGDAVDRAAAGTGLSVAAVGGLFTVASVLIDGSFLGGLAYVSTKSVPLTAVAGLIGGVIGFVVSAIFGATPMWMIILLAMLLAAIVVWGLAVVIRR